MNLTASDLVQPLREAEQPFIQVLLTRFTLTRQDRARRLSVQLDETAPAICMRKAKYVVQQMMPDFERKSARYQAALDAFLLRGEGPPSYVHDDPDFVFRYASGGTLPVVRMGSREYYCLFYREIPPIGWNIANGGCDSRDELLNPMETVERELREELLVIDPHHGRRYVFDWDAGKPLDRPEFAVARRFWKERFRDKDLLSFTEMQLPLKWLDGPDSLEVRMGAGPPRVVGGLFLNVNAEDFGIEVDGVAKINLDEDAVLCDGEVIYDQLVNCPVGLFEVDAFNRNLAAGKTEFMPDVLFYDAARQPAGALERIIHDELMPNTARLRTAHEKERFEAAANKYGLCPVTRRIVSRYVATHGGGPAAQAHAPYEVFISFAGEDRAAAQRVYELTSAHKRAFFSAETLNNTHFGRAIDEALDQARYLIVVGTSVAHLTKGWVEFEWRSFHQDMCNGRNRNDPQLISFVASGIDPNTLPPPLRLRTVVFFDPGNPDAGLRQLGKYLGI